MRRRRSLGFYCKVACASISVITTASPARGVTLTMPTGKSCNSAVVPPYSRYGYRRIRALLAREGWSVSRKQVQRIRRKEGLKVRPKPQRIPRQWTQYVATQSLQTRTILGLYPRGRMRLFASRQRLRRVSLLLPKTRQNHCLETGIWEEHLLFRNHKTSELKPIRTPANKGVWEEFLTVRAGKMENPCPAEVGLRFARLIDLIRKSNESGKTIRSRAPQK